MGREASMKPDYQILAYVTQDKNRVIASNSMALYAKDSSEQETIAQDIAKALKADTVKLKCGDYMIIKV